MNNTSFAYIHARPDGRIFYVGKGSADRVSKIDRPHNKYHCNIVRKYGRENILVGKLECSSDFFALELEKGLIKCLRNMKVSLVNKTEGGEGTSGYKATPEQRLRNSEVQKIAQRRPDVIAKRVAKLRGRPQTPESNLKRSATLKRIRNTQEYHDRHSAAMTGKAQTAEHVRKRMKSVEVPIECVETGLTFQSISEAAKWCSTLTVAKPEGILSNIAKAVRGKQKTAYGFHWNPILTED